jgi:hypothetical protein
MGAELCEEVQQSLDAVGNHEQLIACAVCDRSKAASQLPVSALCSVLVPFVREAEFLSLSITLVSKAAFLCRQFSAFPTKGAAASLSLRPR